MRPPVEETYAQLQHQPGQWVRARVERQWLHHGRWRISCYAGYHLEITEEDARNWLTACPFTTSEWVAEARQAALVGAQSGCLQAVRGTSGTDWHRPGGEQARTLVARVGRMSSSRLSRFPSI